MSYPTKLLNPGEQVAIDVRPHWKYLAGPLAGVAAVVAGAIAALIVSVPKFVLLAIAVLLAVCLVWLGVRYIKWATTSFVVTNERLILRKGVFQRSGREILLDRLTDISYKQTLMDRLTGCGDILLESPGRDSQEVFEDLPHPVAIQNEIYRLVTEQQAARGSGGGGTGPSQAPTAALAPPPPAPAGYREGVAPAPVAAPVATEPTVSEQLSQLDDMRKRGLISRREFAAKKADLLSRM